MTTLQSNDLSHHDPFHNKNEEIIIAFSEKIP